jgi:3-methylcrotonyl-CoA carboxylase alpha subunit
MRKAMGEQCVALSRAVGYYSAGTVELIVSGADPTGESFYFLEMNTRLQVEHPVTEAITGQDLVEWQLRVAAGEPLPLGQDELAIDGWAIEARLYAEDPARGFLPSIGRLDVFRLGGGDTIRIDTGVVEGGEVTPFYDPMIAKLIAHAPTREEARETLADALADTAIWPVRSNAGFLVEALDHPAFVAGQVDTGLIARAGTTLMPPAQPSEEALANAAAALSGGVSDRAGGLPGFRLNAPPRTEALFLLDGAPVTIDMAPAGPIDPVASGHRLIAEDGQVWSLTRWRVDGAGGGGAGDGAILAPMPGRVIAVDVAGGDRVAKGARLATLEAMKMEHGLVAPFDGVVADLAVAVGDQVTEGACLVRIVADEGAG